MSMIGNNIEDIFKDNFNGFKINPSPNIWKGIRGKLWWKEFLQFSTGSINAYYVGAVIVGTLVTYSAVKYTGNKEIETVEDKLTFEEQITENTNKTKNTY